MAIPFFVSGKNCDSPPFLLMQHCESATIPGVVLSYLISSALSDDVLCGTGLLVGEVASESVVGDYEAVTVRTVASIQAFRSCFNGRSSAAEELREAAASGLPHLEGRRVVGFFSFRQSPSQTLSILEAHCCQVALSCFAESAARNMMGGPAIAAFPLFLLITLSEAEPGTLEWAYSLSSISPSVAKASESGGLTVPLSTAPGLFLRTLPLSIMNLGTAADYGAVCTQFKCCGGDATSGRGTQELPPPLQSRQQLSLHALKGSTEAMRSALSAADGVWRGTVLPLQESLQAQIARVEALRCEVQRLEGQVAHASQALHGAQQPCSTFPSATPKDSSNAAQIHDFLSF
jgi:hypothetical protein